MLKLCWLSSFFWTEPELTAAEIYQRAMRSEHVAAKNALDVFAPTARLCETPSLKVHHAEGNVAPFTAAYSQALQAGRGEFVTSNIPGAR